PISSASLDGRFGKAKSSRSLIPFPCILPTLYGKEPFYIITVPWAMVYRAKEMRWQTFRLRRK
ncbi:MAG: hypothetical protein KAU47_04955, partial [Candidatus Aminicenantes bacterium]|nr:hypothetical protein [Candidatus Aminicenantes bacterium]